VDLVVIMAYEACKCVFILSVCSFIANIVGNVHILPIKPHFEASKLL
jgi:hypothetical protein